MAYMVMNESNIVNNNNKRIIWNGEVVGDYLPDYDYLIEHSSCKEEAEKWESAKKRNSTFVFRFVGCYKQKCGHWEIFQHPYNDSGVYSNVEEINLEFTEESSKRRCTRCECGWLFK